MNTTQHPTQPIRVMVVDDHPLVRAGLSAFLSAYDDLVLVAEASSGAETLRLCNINEPDVILMDLVMPDMDGIQTIREVHREHPAIQIIALTSYGQEELVKQALQAGVISYLFKNISANELAEAIRAAKAGKPTLAPEATRILINSSMRPVPLGHDLTQRELEVLTLMVEGLSNPEIAARLEVTRATVKNHISSILSKLGASSRTQAATLALQHHIVQP